MSVLANANAMGAGGVDTGDIPASLRFRSAATAYLSRTSGSPTNKSKWTLSFWVKRAELSRQQVLFGATISASANFSAEFSASNNFRIFFTDTLGMVSTEVERDPTAFVHFVIAYDSANATATNRCRVWKNGAEITSWSTDNRASIGTGNDAWNTNALLHSIGSSNASYKNDDYKTRIAFVDGSAVTDATSFGYFNTEINEWVSKSQSQVKAIVDAGGTNSFMLDFDNATSLTTLGYDKSSKGNNWTLNNFSLTAGTTYDHMLDVPGNSFATLNPLKKATAITTSYGNLRSTSTSYPQNIFATMALPQSGKIYAELFSSTATNSSVGVGFGVCTQSVTPDGAYNATGKYGFYSSTAAVLITGAGGTANISAGWTNTAGLPFKIAADLDAGKVWVGQQTTWWDSSGGTTGDPSTGANPTFTVDARGFNIYCDHESVSAFDWDVLFGQAPLHASATYDSASGGYFRYAPPTGFKALCQRNLPDGESITTSGSFTGTLAADGPYVDIKGVPTAMTINGNAVTFGTHADKTSSGFKLRTASSSYNNTGSNTYSVSTTGAKRKYALAQGNP